MKRAVTQRTLAELAGVTQATVSLALRGSLRIPLGLRQRIQQLAEQHGYRPDPAVVALAHRRWNQSKPLALAYVASLVDGIDRHEVAVREHCAALGIQLWVVPRDQVDQLAGRHIAGIIVGQKPGGEPPLPFPKGIPIVHCGLLEAPEVGDMACADMAAAGATALRGLAEAGFQRVAAAVIAEPTVISDHLLAGGLLASERTLGAGRLAVWVGSNAQRQEGCAWLVRQPADALLLYDAEMADRVRTLGDRRPLAILLAGRERSDLAGTVLPFQQVGSSAVDLLLEGLRDRPAQAGTRCVVLVAMAWQGGRSLKPPPSVRK